MKEIETSLLECEKFSFFCEERQRDAKKHQMAAKNEKIQKICSFCSFFALFLLFGGRRRPKHLQMGHFHTHRYYKFL